MVQKHDYPDDPVLSFDQEIQPEKTHEIQSLDLRDESKSHTLKPDNDPNSSIIIGS
jgi:hypothetical protein